MAVKDWITFPRTEDGWHTRANAWMNELRDCVTTNVVSIATNTSDIADIGVWSDWDPNVGGLTFSVESGRQTQTGKHVTVLYRGTISGVDGAGTFITFTLPVAMTNFVTGDILAWGEAVYQDVNTVYIGKPRSDSSTVISIRPPQSEGLGNGAWRSDGTQPVATFSAGDILSFALTYEAA